MIKRELIEKAKNARKKAYAPYSGFLVGAALIRRDGEVFCGCNVENASFSPTCCAERVAIFNALVSTEAEERKFDAIAIVGGKNDLDADRIPCYPCGVCRQVMSEFFDKDVQIITVKDGTPESVTLGELLPYSFSLKSDALKWE